MKQAEIEKLADSLNINQAYIVRNALEDGVEEQLVKGKKRLSKKDCALPWGYRRNVPAQTKRALRERGLIEGDSYRTHLTGVGVKAAKHLFDKQDIKIEDEDAPGIVFVPKDVYEYVQWVIDQRNKGEREHKALVKKVKRQWRGLKIDTWSGKKSLASQIEEAFGDDRHSGKITLHLDDMEFVGEQIEALRKGA